MGLKIFSLIIIVIAVLVYYKLKPNDTENLKRLEEWSEANLIDLKKSKVEVNTFKVDYDQSEWDLLVKKLELARYFKPLNEKYAMRNEFGFDPEYTKELVEYWKNGFNWKERVNYLNRLPQFKIKFVDHDVTIHFLRVITNKKEGVKPTPLLMFDGWPGSFFGFYKMIDYINENYKSASYDIIVPTIPGFLFSTPLDRPIDTTDTARYFDALMRHIHGENVEYYVHGEDWGSIITTKLAKLFPKRIRGIHITMPPNPKLNNPVFLYYLFKGLIAPTSILTQEEIDNGLRFGLNTFLSLLIKKTGYLHMQATTPDTLGHGLTDSPVGLLAYVLEKYSLGSFDKEKDILGVKSGNLNSYNKDDLLTIITLYWMTNSITSSCRFYKTYFYQVTSEWPKSEISNYHLSPKIPVAVHYFKNELGKLPYALLRHSYPNLTSYTLESKGGHFASFENPKLSAENFISFINSI